MRRLKSVIVGGMVAALLASMAVTAGTAGAQGNRGGSTDVHIIGNFEARGESPQSIPNFADGAELALEDLKKAGFDIEWERIPGGATNAALVEQAFVTSAAKNPDAILGLTSSNVFIPVGPKVAATDIPVFALASPSEGVKSGPSGGDNIFLLRPLNEQTYSKIFEWVCSNAGRKALGIKGPVKISLNLVQTAFGSTVKAIADREIPNYKRCEVVNVTENSATATDLTQQALAIKNSDANVIVSANFPAPSGVLVNQLQQNGVNIPFVGGASLNLAVDAGSIQNLSNLWATDDCVPELEKDKKAKKFVKAYTDKFGYPPNYASAQVYDAMHIIANAVKKVGHDHAALNKELAGTRYDGICDYVNDQNNVLAQSVTIFKYKSPTDKTKVLERKAEIDFIPNEQLGAPTTTVAPAG